MNRATTLQSPKDIDRQLKKEAISRQASEADEFQSVFGLGNIESRQHTYNNEDNDFDEGVEAANQAEIDDLVEASILDLKQAMTENSAPVPLFSEACEFLVVIEHPEHEFILCQLDYNRRCYRYH